jgi:hypothetical protein
MNEVSALAVIALKLRVADKIACCGIKAGASGRKLG